MKVLSRKQSGAVAESLVFAQLVSLGHTVRFASVNQAGYDLFTINPHKKIEVKHIQRVGESSKDSFILKKAQATSNSFDNLVLIISDCTTIKGISKFEFYVFSNKDIQNIIASKKASSKGNYTFNLATNGLSIASTSLAPFHHQWSKI
jgi:hypothetical protein